MREGEEIEWEGEGHGKGRKEGGKNNIFLEHCMFKSGNISECILMMLPVHFSHTNQITISSNILC